MIYNQLDINIVSEVCYENFLHKEYKTDTSVNKFHETWHNSYDDTPQLIAKPFNDIYKYSNLK